MTERTNYNSEARNFKSKQSLIPSDIPKKEYLEKVISEHTSKTDRLKIENKIEESLNISTSEITTPSISERFSAFINRNKAKVAGTMVAMELFSNAPALADTTTLNNEINTTTQTSETFKQGSEYSVTLDVSAQTINGRTMVPVKFVAEALGKEVKWNGDTSPQTVTIKDASTTIVMSKEKSSNTFSKNVLVNGKTITVDVPGQVIDGRTCVPVKFISENTGSAVDYYSDTRQVTILEPGSDGKVIVLTLGSKNARIMENTFETSLRRMATRLTSNSRTEVLNLLANPSGPIDNNLVIVDSRTNAQVNILSNRLVGDNADIMTQATFTTNYGSLNLDSKTLAYQTDKLYFFNNSNYKQINVASPKSTEVKTITSNSDILISYTNGVTTLTNTANEKYNFSTNKWEAPAVVRTEAEKKLIEAAKPYIAAGEFINTATFTNFVEAGKNGSIRVYSTSKPSATEKALFEKFENSGTSKAEFSDGTNIIGINGENVKVANGMADSARFNLITINETNGTENYSSVLYTKLKYDITTKKLVSFTESTGRVLQEYNPSTKKLDYLDPFRNLYTPEQYKQKTEQFMAKNSEISGKYNSKIWLNDANGQPAFCLLVGGSVGTSSDRVAIYQKAVSRLNEIDPNFVKNMRDNSGVQVIMKIEDQNSTPVAVYSRYDGLSKIKLNESNNVYGKGNIDSKEWSIMGIFVVESRGLENSDYENINNGFLRKDLVVNTKYLTIEKQAFQIRQYEIWGEIPQNLRATLDGKTKIDLMTYYTNLDAYFKSKNISDYSSISLGKLSVSEFMTSAGIAGNGYNFYIDLSSK